MPQMPTIKKLSFLVFGHTDKGKPIIVEVEAEHSAEALKIARAENPHCRFNHTNLQNNG